MANLVEWDPDDRTPSANYHFIVSAVAPRPIAWVTTRDPDTGVVNAAPFSWFQSVCADPLLLMLAFADRDDGSPKDTLRNIFDTEEFVVHVSSARHKDAIVASSAGYDPETSEVDALGLDTARSRKVKVPYLVDAPVRFECRLVESHRYGRDDGTTVVLGEVVYIGADADVLDARGNVRSDKVQFLARMGGREYVVADDTFEMARPKV